MIAKAFIEASVEERRDQMIRLKPSLRTKILHEIADRRESCKISDVIEDALLLYFDVKAGT